MKAYVLAAGYATRLWPLTRDTAKPLLEVGGAPILTHLARRLAMLDDLTRIVVIGNHRFADALEAWRRDLDCPVPVQVLDDGSTSDDDKLGAIGDLAFALDRVPVDGEDWLLSAGDHVLLFDLAAPYDRFRERRAPLLMLRHAERGAGPSPYNEVTLEGERVVGFREKPSDPRTDLAAIAFYFFPASAAEQVAQYLASGGNPDAPGHFIAWLVGTRPVYGSRFAGEWLDIGSVESLEAARRRLA